jgi:hypothetical protein
MNRPFNTVRKAQRNMFVFKYGGAIADGALAASLVAGGVYGLRLRHKKQERQAISRFAVLASNQPKEQ